MSQQELVGVGGEGDDRRHRAAAEGAGLDVTVELAVEGVVDDTVEVTLEGR